LPSRGNRVMLLFMRARSRVFWNLLVSVALLLGGCARRRPNVLLVTLDTTRADRMGYAGYDGASTPALDRLAREGAWFESLATTAPITLPAHATLLTGFHPPEHGVRLNGVAALPESVPTVAASFRAEGYRTGAVVAFSTLAAEYGLNRGFDDYLEPSPQEIDIRLTLQPAVDDDDSPAPYLRGDRVADRALAWLQRRGHRKPWFLWVHFFDPHHPYHWNRQAVGIAFTHPYDAEIAFMDLQIARLLAYLDETGMDQETLVVAVGDHGEGLGEHNEETHLYLLYETTVHVPMALRYPGRIPGGQRIAAPASTVQVAPTLLDLAGVSPSPDLARQWAKLKWLPSCAKAWSRASRSDSLAPLLLGTAPAAPSVNSYAETAQGFATYNWAPLRSVRQGDWKLIDAPEPELYHLRQDPRERHNLAAEAGETVERVLQVLREHEDLLTPQRADVLQPSDTTRKALASMGYLAGGGQAPPTDEAEQRRLANPNRAIRALPLAARLLEMLEAGQLGDTTLNLATQVVALAPSTALFHARLARVHEGRGDVIRALSAYRDAVRWNAVGIEERLALGDLLERTGADHEALDVFRETVRLAPGHARARRRCVLALSRRARQALVERRFEEVAAACEEGAKLDPDSAEWAALLEQRNQAR
jgi:arylsulfatase A-like enzyme